MNKFSFWLILVIILGSLPNTTFASPSQEEQLVASLEVLSGGVQVQPNEAEKWAKVTSQVVVGAGDIIRTDEEGEAIITWFADGTVTLLSPNSKLYINEFSGSPTEEDSPFRISMTLNYGRVFNRVHRLISPDSSYEVQTRNFVSTVRGTIFAVGIEEDESTVLMVTEGIVNAAQADNQQDVTVGNWLQGKVGTVLPAPASVETTAQEPLVKEYVKGFKKFEKRLQDKDEDGVVDIIDNCPNLKGYVFERGCVNSNAVENSNRQSREDAQLKADEKANAPKPPKDEKEGRHHHHHHHDHDDDRDGDRDERDDD